MKIVKERISRGIKVFVPKNDRPTKKDLTIIPESIILSEVKDEPSSDSVQEPVKSKKKTTTRKKSTRKRSSKDESGVSPKPKRARKSSATDK